MEGVSIHLSSVNSPMGLISQQTQSFKTTMTATKRLPYESWHAQNTQDNQRGAELEQNVKCCALGWMAKQQR